MGLKKNEYLCKKKEGKCWILLYDQNVSKTIRFDQETEKIFKKKEKP